MYEWEVVSEFDKLLIIEHDNQGDYARSLEYNEKALAIDLQALGPEHEYVLQGHATIAELRALV